MKLSNLKVGQRLSLSYGVLLAMLLVLAVIAYTRISGLSDELNLTNEDRYPKTVLAHTIKDGLNEIAREMRDVLLAADADTTRKGFEHIDATTKVIGGAIEQLDKATVSKAGRDQIAAVAAVRQRFLTARGAFLQLAKDGKKDEARAFLVSDLRQVQADYFAVLEQLVNQQAELMKDSATEAATLAHSARIIVVSLSLAAALAGVLVGVLVTRGITRPLAEAVGVARRVADGDLTSTIVVRSTDETGQLLQALQDMNASLQRIVGQVRTGTDTIATASTQIAVGNLDLSSRTEQQASSLEETASSMEELTSTVKQNADNARQANQLAVSASDVALKGGAVVGRVVDTMSSINESSKKIVDIIGVIDGIAFQTNILALNAAVEAARAGEQGRGFAVVAAEVRNLAQRSAGAAKEIKALIDDSVAKVDVGSALVNQAGSTMNEVVASVQRVTDIMGEITSASHEQEAGIEQINQAISQMDTVTQQNAALVEEAAAAAGSLQDQAGHLAQLVSVFTLAAAPLAGAPATRRPATRAAPRKVAARGKLLVVAG